jgi:hypothetical protein
MIVEGRIGPISGMDGAGEAFRQARLSEQVVMDGGAHFQEAAIRQQLFTAALVAAGLAPGTTLGTTAPLALFNPPNSGKVLSIIRYTFAWASGTLGAGKLWHVIHDPVTATPGGTAVTPRCHNGASVAGAGKAFSSATGLGAANAMEIAATVTALTADTGTGLPVSGNVDGLYVIPPGGAYSLQEVGAAGTSPLVFESITWAEYPI